MFIPALLIGGLLLMAGGGTKKRRPTPAPTPQPTDEEAEAINFCVAAGGTASAMEDGQGNTYFICSFPDGRMVEAMAFYHGEEAPQCPVDMMYDPATETCVLAEGSVEPPEPDDPNFEICMGALLAAWAPFTEDHFNLGPAVAENVYLIMRNAAGEEWAAYKHPEALADFGMTYVAPQCDWYALRDYAKMYQAQYGVWPGAPSDIAQADQIYASVLALATEAMEDADAEPDFQPGPSPNKIGQGKKCPTNYFYDALHDVCCPDGFYWHVGDQMCRPQGYGGYGGLHNMSALQHAYSGGYAGGCGGRRGHCGVRPR